MKNLTPSQVVRIQRIKRIRSQVTPAPNKRVLGPFLMLGLGILCLIGLVVGIIQNDWTPGTELYSRLPELDEQRASITVYAK